MVRLAVDAMGGDDAPRAVVAGAVLAKQRLPDLDLTLVGVEDAVRAEIAESGGDPDQFEIVHTSEIVEMHESPVEALRKKPDSSLRKTISLLKAGGCDGVFSAGNTGAMVAGATMLVGLLPGVRRAGIAVPLPVGAQPVVLIDVGANIQCKPLHLYQYATMACEFISRVYHVERPRIGLLNVGEEDQKGTRLVKETNDLLRGSTLAFVGNVEGRDIFHGDASVVVCDGFVGNIVLKVSEGLWEKVHQLLHGEVANLSGVGGGQELASALSSLGQKLDYNEYGGAPLLGVNGTVIIGHGRSDAKAVANALRWAREMCVVHVNDSIVESLAAMEVPQASSE